jgi:hypothetical protein
MQLKLGENSEAAQRRYNLLMRYDPKLASALKERINKFFLLVPKLHLGTKYGVQAQLGHTIHRFQAKLGNETSITVYWSLVTGHWSLKKLTADC